MNKQKEIAKRLQGVLRGELMAMEPESAGLGIEPLWNRIPCKYVNSCDWKGCIGDRIGKRGECLYNPAMFECLAYQFNEEHDWKPFI